MKMKKILAALFILLLILILVLVVRTVTYKFGKVINGKTNCSTFTKHFVPNLILLTQNKMCILLRWFHLFSSFVYLCISLA